MSAEPASHLESEIHSRYGGWAVVTGASDGLGRELARQLADQGFDLVIVARRREQLVELQHQLQGRHGVTVLPVPADLGTDDGISTVIEATRALDVGVLVAAAGFGGTGTLMDRNLETERGMLRVNCDAPLVLTHHFGNLMRGRGRGAVVLVSSILGFQGITGSANYAATKAYVQSLGEGLEQELAPDGVDVVVTAPGPINTGFGSRAGMDVSAGASPEDVAAATLARLPGSGTVIPGPRAKLIRYGTGALPRGLRTRIISSAIAGMARSAKTAK